MKSNKKQYKTRQFRAVISSIFACTFREAIISVLTERAPLALNRADAEKAR